MSTKEVIATSIASLVWIGAVAHAQSPITTMRLGKDQIALVKTARGITTRLSFIEQIQEIICGDLYDPTSGTGSFVVQRSGNDVFVKPIVPKGFSNMFVKVGEKGEKVYNFDLLIVPAGEAYRIVNVIDVQATFAGVKKQPQKDVTPPVIISVDANAALSDAVSGKEPEIIGFEVQPSAAPKPIEPPVIKSDDIAPREAIRRVPAEYPETARSSGVRGEVVVEVAIDEKGKVTSARAISGHVLLRGPAVLAARLWRFNRVKDPDEPRQETARITFNFQGDRNTLNSLISSPNRDRP